MEKNQIIVRSGDEKWQLIEQIKNEAKSGSNNLMYLLAEYIEKYGAAREDILDYLAEHPLKSINSISVINEVKGLIQRNVSAHWMECVQDILKFREGKASLYIDELKRAVSAGLPYEVFREGLETEDTPYELHLYLDEKINGFLDKLEDQEQERMLQLDYLVDRLNKYYIKMETLLEKMENVLNKQENAVIQSSTFSEQVVEQSIVQQESNIIFETGEEDPEEMYFDESFVPAIEFEEIQDSEDIQERKDPQKKYFDESFVPPLELKNTDDISDIENDNSMEISNLKEEELVPELDDITDLSTEDGLSEDFMPELEMDFLTTEKEIEESAQTQKEQSGGQNKDKSFMGEDSKSIMEEVFHNKEESTKRYKRLMATAARMFAMEKRRFLNKSSEEQKEFLIKRLLEKKAEISKVNVLKSLFEHFSNEYLYDLVIRDATQAELENLLLLSK